MIQPDLLTRVRLLAEAYRLPVAAADRPREVTPASAVQQVLAEVEARLPDGRFRVLAAGQRFDVDLPASTRPGERIQVSLPQAAQPNSAALAAAAHDVDAKVSETGRYLTQVLLRDTGSNRSSASLGAAQPLLPDAPPDVAATAATLRELIGLSGLFYESHQAEWVNGARDTTELLREPQGRAPPLPGRQAPAAALDATIEKPAASQGMDAAVAPRLGAEAAAEMRSVGIHPDTAPIVQQQINALETSHIVWSGQVWPGQPMRWEIEPAEGEQQGAPGAGRTWQTRIDLALPRLGNLSAVLNLDPAGLRVRVSAQGSDTDALIGGRLADLRSALAAAGLPLVSVVRTPYADA